MAPSVAFAMTPPMAIDSSSGWAWNVTSVAIKGRRYRRRARTTTCAATPPACACALVDLHQVDQQPIAGFGLGRHPHTEAHGRLATRPDDDRNARGTAAPEGGLHRRPQPHAAPEAARGARREHGRRGEDVGDGAGPPAPGWQRRLGRPGAHAGREHRAGGVQEADLEPALARRLDGLEQEAARPLQVVDDERAGGATRPGTGRRSSGSSGPGCRAPTREHPPAGWSWGVTAAASRQAWLPGGGTRAAGQRRPHDPGLAGSQVELGGWRRRRAGSRRDR